MESARSILHWWSTLPRPQRYRQRYRSIPILWVLAINRIRESSPPTMSCSILANPCLCWSPEISLRAQYSLRRSPLPTMTFYMEVSEQLPKHLPRRERSMVTSCLRPTYGSQLIACPGFFYYHNDTQETDIEIVTYEPDQIYFTNQPVHYGNPSTVSAPAPPDMTNTFHEYRLDWIPGQTLYYIDGVLVQNLTTNIPSMPGKWMWNNWRSVSSFLNMSSRC